MSPSQIARAQQILQQLETTQPDNTAVRVAKTHLREMLSNPGGYSDTAARDVIMLAESRINPFFLQY